MKHYILISLTGILVLGHCFTIQSGILNYFPDIGLESAINKLCNEQIENISKISDGKIDNFNKIINTTIDSLSKISDTKIDNFSKISDAKIDTFIEGLTKLRENFKRDNIDLIKNASLCIPAAIAGTIFGYEAYKGIKTLFYKLYKKLTTKQCQKKSIKKNDAPSALEINEDTSLTVLDFIDPIFNTTLLTCCIAAILNSDTIVRQTSLQVPCAQPAQ